MNGAKASEYEGVLWIDQGFNEIVYVTDPHGKTISVRIARRSRMASRNKRDRYFIIGVDNPESGTKPVERRVCIPQREFMKQVDPDLVLIIGNRETLGQDMGYKAGQQYRIRRVIPRKLSLEAAFEELQCNHGMKLPENYLEGR